jgi:hypothetical protein
VIHNMEEDVSVVINMSRHWGLIGLVCCIGDCFAVKEGAEFSGLISTDMEVSIKVITLNLNISSIGAHHVELVNHPRPRRTGRVYKWLP